MRLQEALAVNRSDIVSFVGAGGKTTAMYRLAHELVSLSWRVVTTTTTMIRPPTPEQSEETILEADSTPLLKKAGGGEAANPIHYCPSNCLPW